MLVALSVFPLAEWLCPVRYATTHEPEQVAGGNHIVAACPVEG